MVLRDQITVVFIEDVLQAGAVRHFLRHVLHDAVFVIQVRLLHTLQHTMSRLLHFARFGQDLFVLLLCKFQA